MRCVQLTAGLALALVLHPMAAVDGATADSSGLRRVLAADGGAVLTCVSRSNGFVVATWWLANSRRSDVVRATAKTRYKEFGSDVWEPWADVQSYQSGWVNPGNRRAIMKESSTASATEIQTKVTVVSRASGRKKTRVIGWSRLSGC